MCFANSRDQIVGHPTPMGKSKLRSEKKALCLWGCAASLPDLAEGWETHRSKNANHNKKIEMGTSKVILYYIYITYRKVFDLSNCRPAIPPPPPPTFLYMNTTYAPHRRRSCRRTPREEGRQLLRVFGWAHRMKVRQEGRQGVAHRGLRPHSVKKLTMGETGEGGRSTLLGHHSKANQSQAILSNFI